MYSYSIVSTFCFVSIFSLILTSPAYADEQQDWKRFRFELEGGPVWQTKNDVRIPGSTGTEFSLQDLTGSGPYATGRFTFDWNIRKQHGVRVEVVPLSFDDTGTFNQPVTFAGSTFAQGTSTKGKYKFDTYRLSYRYLFLDNEAWRMRVGATLLIRDAEIELQQAGVSASDSNLGVAPLLNFSTEWSFAERWTAIFDFEGLAGGPGRAIDLAFKMQYDLTDRWSVGGGYRMLEGGVDTDDTFNFSWFHYGFLNVGYQF